jgi:hypothetical protein
MKIELVKKSPVKGNNKYSESKIKEDITGSNAKKTGNNNKFQRLLE